MQFTWALPLVLGLVTASVLPAEAVEAREANAAAPAYAAIEELSARAPAACVPLCSGAVDIGAAACGTCGQQGPCRHISCSGGRRVRNLVPQNGDRTLVLTTRPSKFAAPSCRPATTALRRRKRTMWIRMDALLNGERSFGCSTHSIRGVERPQEDVDGCTGDTFFMIIMYL